MTQRSWRFVAVAGGAALLLGLYDRAAAPAAPAPATHTVNIDGTTFDPQTLTVKVGDAVVWVNKDPFPHTATAKEGAFDSASIDTGRNWTYRTEKKGNFDYLCAFHPTMTGSLRVE